MRNAFLTALIAATISASPILAQDGVPKRVKFKNPPEPMTCNVGDPFSKSFHTKGTSGSMTTIRGTLYIICPTRYAKWKDTRIPINWFNEAGNGYTDCDRRAGKPHRCWITVPN